MVPIIVVEDQLSDRMHYVLVELKDEEGGVVSGRVIGSLQNLDGVKAFKAMSASDPS